MSEIIDRLRTPFPPERISWRVGSTTKDKKRGMALAFIDARDVMERLDEVVGPENWQNTYPHANGKTVCRIEIRLNGEWVGKEDGAGDTDFEAEKGALSDAFKRAAVRWGIGRYLYDVDAPWVELEGDGKRIQANELPKLKALLTGRAPVPQKQGPGDTPPALSKPVSDDKGAWQSWARNFMTAAKAAPTHARRQELYKTHETTIKALRDLYPSMADYLDQQFAGLAA